MEGLAERVDADERFVIIVSDANFRRSQAERELTERSYIYLYEK